VGRPVADDEYFGDDNDIDLTGLTTMQGDSLTASGGMADGETAQLHESFEEPRAEDE
jgi:hypothetical protein